MRSYFHSRWLNVFLIFAAGAFGACSSSSGSPNGAGGSTGDAAAAGGSNGDAAHDAPASTDTQVSDAAFDYPFADGPTSPMNMTLTIAALAGGTFPDANTCAGVNTSPAMSWTAGPAGTLSYAVVLTDTFQNAAHWVIWDIPSTVTSLAAALPGTATLTIRPGQSSCTRPHSSWRASTIAALAPKGPRTPTCSR